MRTAAQKTKRRVSRTKSFPAPRRGWISNENLAASKPEGASILENFFPTPTGARMRRGSDKYATVGAGDPITSKATYKNGNSSQFFATTETALYDISTVVDADTSPTPVFSGLTGGAWSWLQFETAAGAYLIGVNGQDNGLVYDGVTWLPVTGSSVYRLNYDAQTVNWGAPGITVTGGTSGATGVLYRDFDSGTTGYLWLTSVTGTFQDNETITASTGSATANGLAVIVSPAITGIALSSLSYLASHNSRIWAVEKNSTNAYYLDPEAIAGAVTKFPLGGIFKRGGSLLFIAEWSQDEGSGLSASLAFVTTEGEVAVYAGTDPTTAATWALRGVYRIGIPLGKDAWIKAGGDIIIATDIGMVPLSQAVAKDMAALTLTAISSPIEDEWSKAVAARTSRDWVCELWPTKQMLLVAFPPSDFEQAGMFAANLLTGAWAFFTAWDGTTLQLYEDRMFWGTDAGLVVEAEVTGADQGMPYVCVCVPLFDDCKSPAALKQMTLARMTYRAAAPAVTKMSAQYDFDVNLPTPPNSFANSASSVWGGGVWGEAVWAEPVAQSTYGEWQSVNGAGYALAPAGQITSGNLSAPDLDMIRIDAIYEIGDAVS